MSGDLQFQVKQIVWATVQQFPAWPAKIVKKFNQHGKTVFKVNFFDDPSYCYLHSHSLSHFSLFQNIELTCPEQNQKLKRAFELAKLFYSKQTEKISFSKTQLPHGVTQLVHLPINFQMSEIQSQEDANLPQKTEQFQYKNIGDNILNCPTSAPITPQNVIEALDSYHKARNSQQLQNIKRKQIISYQNELKQNLLFKYKLIAVDCLTQTINSNQNQCVSVTLKQMRRIKKQNKRPSMVKFGVRQRCMRKIHRVLIQKGIQRHMAGKVTFKIITQIQPLLQLQKPINLDEFKQNIIRILHLLGSNLQSIGSIQSQYLQRQILSLIDIQLHHNKIQEGSKMTQINEEFVV